MSGRLRALLIAPPGAGKGTQAHAISAEFGVEHISTGALFRAQVAAGTEVGRTVAGYLDRGDLVPDDLVEVLVRERVRDAVAATGGYLLDGFPRTLAQAHAAHAFAEEVGITAHAVLTFDAPRPVLLARLLGRGAGGRTDDEETTIRHRLDVFDAETAPVLDYYGGLGVLIHIDGDQPVTEVTRATIAALRAAVASAPA